ncbi:DHH family phosphoesterase [Steroidobacter sp. S1-65]|uniref:DHH family phosphoesterase n=1 Tax=Steroidobacter gossypii TaxID=2805490 RepID=A0ABS1WVC7_9GAMM|nr:DHH family phosphoesterase [Steroidobacter gossypii]MBM0104932.1 DHH family phosphoesterase [Steroidobacter gossypii]
MRNPHSPPSPDNAAADAEHQRAFAAGLATFGNEPVLILAHHDADGLASATLFARTLPAIGRQSEVRLVGRGENPWSAEIRAELARRKIGGLIVVDLGARDGVLREGTPTIVVDHHVPQGAPAAATLITGFGMSPIPTSSLLSYRCASILADATHLLWLAAIGIIGDMAEGLGFPEMDQARARYGLTVLRAATTLINQPRRSSSGDATPALALLLKAKHPREIVSGEHPETAQLIAARDEVRSELERVRRTAPRVNAEVALIQFASACQIHPLIAQMWSQRMKRRVVIAANHGFRAGWVHFAARAAADVDLVAFLRDRAPAVTDASYGGGHRKASGGALQVARWNEFVGNLGFGAEAQVAE